MGNHQDFRKGKRHALAKLIIAADRGEEGKLAADYLFKRANDLGLKARIETPSDVGYDWNRYDQDKVIAHGWNFQGAQESA